MMGQAVTVGGRVIVAVALIFATGMRAQTPAMVPTAANAQSGRVEAEVLSRKISLKLQRATLKDALDAIASAGRVRLAYSRSEVPLDKVVSLVVDTITVGDALTVLLRDTGVRVSVASGGRLVLERRENVPVARATNVGEQHTSGGIAGTVTDTLTQAVVPYVLVKIDETGQSVRGGADGKYVIEDVAAGPYHVTARRVGFVAKTRTVTVEDAKVAKLDFKLNQPPTHLDEVVTTANGDQRRYEVGNSIATINVDSLVPTTPVMSITDILQARVPGLQVVETGGLAGSGEAIRIRGQSSVLLPGDPIIIIDGIRSDNTPGGSTGGLFSAVPSPSRLNDLDISQIASIDILRGPAATTEYGTDASNGIIIIKTKRGTSGKAQWNASADQDVSREPFAFPEYYYSWGHLTNGSRTPVQCPLVSPSGIGSAQGTCAVDSVTHFDPLNHSATSIFGSGVTNRENLSVGGGSETMRYFLGAALSNEDGLVRLPTTFQAAALAAGFGRGSLKPNAYDNKSMRAKIAIDLSSTADVSVTAGYMSTYQSTPAGGQLTALIASPPVVDDSAHYFGYGTSASDPVSQLGRQANQQTDRLTAGLNATWRPRSWLLVVGDVGIDHGSQSGQQEILPQVALYQSAQDSAGNIYIAQSTTSVYSADLRASATWSPIRWLHLTTSIGANYADTRVAGVTGIGGGIGVGNPTFTLDGASSTQAQQLGSRSASLGAYVNEAFALPFGLHFETGLRTDAGSGYGSAYKTSLDPKFDLSFVPLRGPTVSARIRTAFGFDGRQPPNGASLLLYQLGNTAFVNGQPVSTVSLVNIGNPHLQPEQSQELEFGPDLGFLNDRVTLEFTAFYKRTQHALVSTQLGLDLASVNYTENIGEIENNGVEADVNALVVKSRSLTWSVSANGMVRHNKLLRFDPGFQQSLFAIEGEYDKVGYPLYGYWGNRMHFADANHDGVIEPNEVTADTALTFFGNSLPTQTVSISTHIGFFGSAVTIGARFDYAGGYRVENTNSVLLGESESARVQNDPHAPLAQQALAVCTLYSLAGTCSGLLEDGSFIRFRELSLAYSIPRRWLRRVPFNNVSVMGGVRNLALWTRFTGPDPEVSDPGGGNAGTGNDYRSSGTAAVPLPRTYFVRFNLGL